MAERGSEETRSPSHRLDRALELEARLERAMVPVYVRRAVASTSHD